MSFRSISKHEWRRVISWKTDVVDLRIREAPTWDVNIRFAIIIPSCELVGTTDWPFQYFDQTNVGLLNEREMTCYELPGMSLMMSRRVKKIVSDFEKALPWFDQYATPADCLAKLTSIHKPSSPAYKDADQYFRTKINEEAKTTPSQLA